MTPDQLAALRSAVEKQAVACSDDHVCYVQIKTARALLDEIEALRKIVKLAMAYRDAEIASQGDESTNSDFDAAAYAERDLFAALSRPEAT